MFYVLSFVHALIQALTAGRIKVASRTPRSLAAQTLNQILKVGVYVVDTNVSCYTDFK